MGGKGGSDFDPKGKSDNEVVRFCQAFVTELSVMWVQIQMFRQETLEQLNDGFMVNKRLRNEFTGVLTGGQLVEV